MGSTLDAEVTSLARRIAELGSGQRAGVYRMSWWSERMLAWAMANASFKTQLFRLVDVFPATAGDADVLRHLHEYFAGADAPRLLDTGIDLAERFPLGEKVTAQVARRNIARMARQFIVGVTPAQVVATLERLWRAGIASTVDLLGERTVAAAEADAYAARLGELLRALIDGSETWAPDDHLERDDLGPLPRVSVSVKATALAPRYAPLTSKEGKAEVSDRLRPLLALAAERGVLVWLDMEHYDTKDVTVELFRELLCDPALAGLNAGIVLQSYLKDCYADLSQLVAFGAERLRRTDGAKPLWVRLVKGAYWDTETVQAEAEGWPAPVFVDKGQTDANFERCARLLLDHHGEVRAAFGSHNLRSLAYAVVYARHLGIPDSGYELQLLYGMAEPVSAALRRLGLRLRVYAPMGELVPGMSYLVRRLLENTANESFVRHRFAEGRSLDELVAPPPVIPLPGPDPPVERASTVAGHPRGYRHEPRREWRRGDLRSRFAEAVGHLGRRLAGGPGIEVPALIGGEQVRTRETIVHVDPADPEVVVSVSASAGPSEADAAVARGVAAGERWRRVPARERARVVFRAAAWLRQRRDELAALCVFEAGKPWADADADVCEAIDFCEYYGREMLRMDGGARVESPPGETNVLGYQAKGVAAVIGPWNFPLAIPTGMTVAALVAGNAVVLKPAEQTPATAAALVEALLAGGLPPDVLAFLPGRGEVVGERLVAHPDVALVAFTGSKEVGLAINRTAASVGTGQRQVKRVVAEMGGKNAMVIDADADLDQAVPAVASSAFGFAGQKCSACSRVVAVDGIHDRLVQRLVGAARVLGIGHPRCPGTVVGPLIDADALARVQGYLARAPAEGRVALSGQELPERGWFVGPMVVDEVAPDASLARDEVFGPVLAVLRASSFEEAVAVANDTDYALTAGVFSRSPAHIAMAAAELRAGNVYVNRGITGAVPGRQPFGGYGLSGVGSKAGGPDYLLQFTDPKVVTENTVRQGFAPVPPPLSPLR